MLRDSLFNVLNYARLKIEKQKIIAAPNILKMASDVTVFS